MTTVSRPPPSPPPSLFSFFPLFFFWPPPRSWARDQHCCLQHPRKRPPSFLAFCFPARDLPRRLRERNLVLETIYGPALSTPLFPFSLFSVPFRRAGAKLGRPSNRAAVPNQKWPAPIFFFFFFFSPPFPFSVFFFWCKPFDGTDRGRGQVTGEDSLFSYLFF